MARSYFLPTDDAGKAAALDLFALQLPKYKTVLDLSDTDLSSSTHDAGTFRHTHNCQQLIQAAGQEWTAFKNYVRDGGTAPATMPAAPVLPPSPPAVAAGIIPRFTALVARIKSHRNYTDAIGRDLGIVGAERTVDPTTWKPTLGIEYQAGRPVVLWNKGGASAVEVWVDRSDGKGFVFLAIDTHPPCPDQTPLPAAGASAVWKYRAIYRLRDEQVGQWSDVLSIIVGGA